MHFSRARLRGHRDGQKRPESAVAEAAGLSAAEYQLIELGRLRPTEGQELALADALGVPVDELHYAGCVPEDYGRHYIQAVLQYGAPMSDETVQRVAGVLRRPRAVAS
jgi:transcriptional regulator with XRE-family HTH domain